MHTRLLKHPAPSPVLVPFLPVKKSHPQQLEISQQQLHSKHNKLIFAPNSGIASHFSLVACMGSSAKGKRFSRGDIDQPLTHPKPMHAWQHCVLRAKALPDSRRVQFGWLGWWKEWLRKQKCFNARRARERCREDRLNSRLPNRKRYCVCRTCIERACGESFELVCQSCFSIGVPNKEEFSETLWRKPCVQRVAWAMCAVELRNNPSTCVRCLESWNSNEFGADLKKAQT